MKLFVSVRVLYDVTKNSKFPLWNDFQYCLTAVQADRVNRNYHTLAHAQSGRDSVQFARFRAKVLRSCIVVFRFVFCSVQNIELNLNEVVPRS